MGMKNTPLYRVLIRNVDTGVEHVPGRYEVGTKVYSRKTNAVAAAKRLNSEWANSTWRRGSNNLEAFVIETDTNWREVEL
jgi:hypothetical protein